MAESDWQRPDLFKLLEIAETGRRYHHDALWRSLRLLLTGLPRDCYKGSMKHQSESREVE